MCVCVCVCVCVCIYIYIYNTYKYQLWLQNLPQMLSDSRKACLPSLMLIHYI